MMERNLDRRVEAMTPVKDPALATQLGEMLAIMRRDDRRAWTLGRDGEWTRVATTIEGEPTTDTFAALMTAAVESVSS
jgi:polyphosphate kinase